MHFVASHTDNPTLPELMNGRLHTSITGHILGLSGLQINALVEAVKWYFSMPHLGNMKTSIA